MLSKARKRGESVLAKDSERQVKKDIANVAGAMFDAGKGALAEILHRQAQATEYLLHEDRLEVSRPGHTQSVLYSTVHSIARKGDEIIVAYESGTLTIKPHAHIVSGRIRVPIGWSRNGIEVAYGVLADELAARCKVNITTS